MNYHYRIRDTYNYPTIHTKAGNGGRNRGNEGELKSIKRNNSHSRPNTRHHEQRDAPQRLRGFRRAAYGLGDPEADVERDVDPDGERDEGEYVEWLCGGGGVS